MKKLLYIVLGVSIASLAACGGEASSSPDNQATVLETSQHGAIEDVVTESYHDQAAFKAGWDKAYAGQSAPSMPTIDFTKNTVVLFSLGQHKTGGYKARVLRATPIQGAYAVGFEVTIPGIGCHGTSQETTKPFIIISVPTTMDPVFDEAVQRRQPDCTAK